MIGSWQNWNVVVRYLDWIWWESGDDRMFGIDYILWQGGKNYSMCCGFRRCGRGWMRIPQTGIPTDFALHRAGIGLGFAQGDLHG